MVTVLWRLARRALNVLRGSHKLGRVDHSQQERGEMHADPEARPSPLPSPLPHDLTATLRAQRVELAMGTCERVVCELSPGDGNRRSLAR